MSIELSQSYDVLTIVGNKRTVTVSVPFRRADIGQSVGSIDDQSFVRTLTPKHVVETRIERRSATNIKILGSS